MRVEVVCPTMNQNDFSKVKYMNLQTAAVFANQAGRCDFAQKSENGLTFTMVTTDTIGASINRNIGIDNSSADIIIFSDDDQTFVDGYEGMILNAFVTYPDADAVKFYCESTTPTRPLSYKNPGCWKKAKRSDLMSAGVHGFAIKRDFLIRKNIRFNEEIGPGKEIYCGEDTSFIVDLFKNDATIYLSPQLISYIDQSDSSWFDGYTERHFISVGYIYSVIYGIKAPLAAVRRCVIMTKKTKDFSCIEMLKLMLAGIQKHRRSADRL